MTTLAAFLAERLDEDEAAALAATPGGWHHSDAHGSCVVTADRQSMIADLSPEGGSWRGQWSDAAHIARHDPARVLAEVAAKRAVLAEHDPVDPCDANDASFKTIPCDTLRHLAAIYGDHPDYDESWRP